MLHLKIRQLAQPSPTEQGAYDLDKTSVKSPSPRDSREEGRAHDVGHPLHLDAPASRGQRPYNTAINSAPIASASGVRTPNSNHSSHIPAHQDPHPAANNRQRHQAYTTATELQQPPIALSPSELAYLNHCHTQHLAATIEPALLTSVR